MANPVSLPLRIRLMQAFPSTASITLENVSTNDNLLLSVDERGKRGQNNVQKDISKSGFQSLNFSAHKLRIVLPTVLQATGNQRPSSQ